MTLKHGEETTSINGKACRRNVTAAGEVPAPPRGERNWGGAVTECLVKACVVLCVCVCACLTSSGSLTHTSTLLKNIIVVV